MEPNRRKLPGRTRSSAVIHGLDVLLALTGAAAVAALVLEYGFHEPAVDRRILHGAETAILAIFVLDRFARLAVARYRAQYLRENAIDFILMVVAVVVLAVQRQAVLSFGALYVFITQAYILVVLVLRAVGLNLMFAESGIPPAWLLIGSFAFLILAGSGLLMLPVAVHEEYYPNWNYLDSLFTATSATCVTGLAIRNTGGHFTVFGQAVILAMIQCGGLGLMLFGTVLGLLVRRGLSMRQTETFGQMISSEGTGKLARVAVFVILIAFAFEIVGVAAMVPMFLQAPDTYGRPLSTAGAVWYGVFHSVSAFCNAGFSLYGNNLMQGVREGWASPLRGHWQILGVIAPLIFLGGVGFPVLEDCARYLVSFVRRQIGRIRTAGNIVPRIASGRQLTLQSKIVLTTSLALVAAGASVLLLVEPIGPQAPRIGLHRKTEERSLGDWRRMGAPQRIREAVFQSVTARTAGFNTIDLAELSDAGKLWMCLLMIIGGSPASTAGGMKTLTFALLILATYCQLRRRPEVEAFRRSIPLAAVGRALTLATLYLLLLTVVTLLLCVAQGPGYSCIDLFFEACSACGTVGLSTGVTGSLGAFSKIVIIAGMFVGRLGPLTLLAALTGRLRQIRYSYPSEDLVIG